MDQGERKVGRPAEIPGRAMNCFVHRSVTAVGVCKSCSKALCPECAAELKNGIACRDSCEERVNIINWIVDSNTRYAAAANSHVRIVDIMAIVFGFIFAAAAVLQFQQSPPFWTCMGTIGVLSLAFGLWQLRAGPVFPDRNNDRTDSKVGE